MQVELAQGHANLAQAHPLTLRLEFLIQQAILTRRVLQGGLAHFLVQLSAVLLISQPPEGNTHVPRKAVKAELGMGLCCLNWLHSRWRAGGASTSGAPCRDG